jgi:hypothetical protein
LSNNIQKSKSYFISGQYLYYQDSEILGYYYHTYTDYNQSTFNFLINSSYTELFGYNLRQIELVNGTLDLVIPVTFSYNFPNNYSSYYPDSLNITIEIFEQSIKSDNITDTLSITVVPMTADSVEIDFTKDNLEDYLGNQYLYVNVSSVAFNTSAYFRPFIRYLAWFKGYIYDYTIESVLDATISVLPLLIIFLIFPIMLKDTKLRLSGVLLGVYLSLIVLGTSGLFPFQLVIVGFIINSIITLQYFKKNGLIKNERQDYI